MVNEQGLVKLLDFGLAKAFTGEPAQSPSLENSPTLTMGVTQLGVILGTAAYMSPEQAKGKLRLSTTAATPNPRSFQILDLGCSWHSCA